ncbi:MAG: DNA polymerase III subunit delta, partial [Firmicutes bacterium]|nr:DNA polymerase III subunit delta [Bacillota bacterium]
YACKIARELSARISTTACRQALAEVADVEYAIKSGQVSETTALMNFYMRLAERSRAGRSA